MKAVEKGPLLFRFRWAAWLLMAAYGLYGLAGFIGQRVLSAQAVRGVVDMGTYQSRLAAYNLALGIVVSAALLAGYVLCVASSRGAVKAGFILGLPSALGPVVAALSSTLLFSVLALPGMGAGSVISAAVSALVLMLPGVVLFILWALTRRNTKGSRWLSALAALVSLLAALFPVAAVVLAMVVMPGNPAVAPYMSAAAIVIHLRPVVLALGILSAYLLNRPGAAPAQAEKAA